MQFKKLGTQTKIKYAKIDQHIVLVYGMSSWGHFYPR